MAEHLTEEQMAEVGRRLRAARVYAGLTAKALGEKLGSSEPTVKRWESGRPGERNRAVMKVRQMAFRIAFETQLPWPILDGLRFGDEAEDPDQPGESTEAIDALRVQLGDIEDRLGALEAGSSRQARPGRAEDEPPR